MPTLYVEINRSQIGSFPDNIPTGLDHRARISLEGTTLTCPMYLIPSPDVTGPNVDRNFYEQSFGAIYETEPDSGYYKSFFVSAEIADTLNIVDRDETRANDDAVVNANWDYSFFNVAENDFFAYGTLRTPVILFTQPSSGLIELSGAVEFGEIGDGSYGSFRYTPDPTFTGTVSFEYTIEDSDGTTDTATVTIEVIGDRIEAWSPPSPDPEIDTEQEIQDYIDEYLIRRETMERRGWDIDTSEEIFGPNPPPGFEDLVVFQSAPYQFDALSNSWQSTAPNASEFAQGSGEYSYFSIISDTLASGAIMALQAFGVARGYGNLSQFLSTANDARDTFKTVEQHQSKQIARLNDLTADGQFDFEKFDSDFKEDVDTLIINLTSKVPFIGPLVKKLSLQSNHSDVSYTLSTANVGVHLSGDHSDRILMGDEDDVLDAGRNEDFLFGMSGNDSLRGGDGSDILSGSEGNDSLFGDDGDDQVWGGDGSDFLEGGQGADYLMGGDGADVLFGGQGNDSIDGGEGDDFVSYSHEGGEYGVAVFVNEYAWDTYSTLDTLEGIENVFASSKNDFVFGNSADNRIALGDGDDWALSGGGADVIDGSWGNDIIELSAYTYFTKGYVAHNVSSQTQVGTNVSVNLGGLARHEAVSQGGPGWDTIELSEEGDAFFLHDSYSRFNQIMSLDEDFQGFESMARFALIEEINGGGGDDVIDLTSPDYSFSGFSMLIDGGDGDDIIWGSDGDETIYGGAGDDIIFAGIGSDLVIGGLGADRFEITATSDLLKIGDFNPSEGDTIRFYNTDGFEVLRTNSFDSVFYSETSHYLRMIVDGPEQRLYPSIDLRPIDATVTLPIQGVMDAFEDV